jgi:hypothetical protein
MDDVESGLALLQSLLEALELQISSFGLLSFGIGLVTGLEL